MTVEATEFKGVMFPSLPNFIRGLTSTLKKLVTDVITHRSLEWNSNFARGLRGKLKTKTSSLEWNNDFASGFEGKLKKKKGIYDVMTQRPLEWHKIFARGL